eukprot:CAMPEP_0184861228 /NCGR_PEP_ID=MMETSP0580-20130426/5968_1 /TAXON_ID=1118495 /ORGANISM="Dactyliosolen fragilissimus" /LENGTH=229 /DNA_ID=CAMNT_0027358651 /DNA_START=332 /DNA_END=1021 /DNA_ORIENTATION=-
MNMMTSTTLTAAASSNNNNVNNNNNNNNNNNKASLTDENSTWRLRISVNGVPTKNGRKVGELFNVDVKFRETEGYEPPQGDLVQVIPRDEDGNERRCLRIKDGTGTWKLSEDPDERKDGLWVWGLFKEPLYPFLLLQFETEEFSLPGYDGGGDDDDGGDFIMPMALFAKIDHKRDRDTGMVELGSSSLNFREKEFIKADPFGAAMAEYYEEVRVGQLSLRPLDNEMIKK